jgi:hypothetical protein
MTKLIKVEDSNLPTKKMKAIFRTETGTKTVHFGAKGMDDYTLTHDIQQRAHYRQRHQKDLETKGDAYTLYKNKIVLYSDLGFST